MNWLTKQEELFLLAIFRMKDDSYLVNIRDHLIEHTGKEWAFGSIYMTLERLRKKGLVETKIGSPSTERGGKAIKYYTLTDAGIKVLLDQKRVQDTMWKEFTDFALTVKDK